MKTVGCDSGLGSALAPLLVTVIALLSAPFSVQADQGCIDYRDFQNPLRANHITLPEVVLDLVVSGDLLFLAEGGRGIRVMDLSSPFSPVSSAVNRSVGFVHRIAIDGSAAYLATGTSGLQVIDLSDQDSRSLPVLGVTTEPTDARGVAIQGDYAYVADHGDGTALEGALLVVNRVRSDSLFVAVEVATAGRAADVTVVDTLAFVADGRAGLTVVSVSGPDSALTAAVLSSTQHSVQSEASDVEVVGDYAYLADGPNGLVVIDITAPDSTVIVAQVPVQGNARQVQIEGSVAYVVDDALGLQTVDVSDPLVPFLIGNVQADGLSYAVAVVGNHAYLSTSVPGLSIFDLTSPFPPQVGSLALPEGGFHTSVAVQTDIAYVAAGELGIHMVGLSDPTNPAQLGTYSSGSAAIDVAVSGTHAYVATIDGDLEIVDVSTPADPRLEASFALPAIPLGVAVTDDRAYVACGQAGIQIVNVSVPSAPTLARSITTNDRAIAVAIGGGYAYVADGEAGLQIIDRATGAIVAGEDTDGVALRLALSGNLAYVVDRFSQNRLSSGVQIIDITDPLAPESLHFAETETTARDVVATDQHVYVANGRGGVMVFWVVDPTAPTALGLLPAFDGAMGLALSGSCLVVADRYFGLLIGATQCDPSFRELFSSPAVRHGQGGTEITWSSTRWSQPAAFNLYRSSELHTRGAPMNGSPIEGTEHYSYVDDSVEPGRTYRYRVAAVGIGLHDIVSDPIAVDVPTDLLETWLGSSRPNPFREMTTIPFTLGAPTTVQLNVFDLSGRLVRRLLHDVELSPGAHTVSWDGLDSFGRRAASGVYFYQIETETLRKGRRLVVLGHD